VYGVNSRCIQTALIMLFRGELAKHGINEGTIAITKCFNPSGGGAPERGLGKRAGLQFVPEHVALVAGRLSPNTALSEGAAIYLAAVLEYLVAEIFELAGNRAGASDPPTTYLTPRLLFLSI
jgi:hypothetical protein